LKGAGEFRAAVQRRATNTIDRETANPDVREWLTFRAYKPA
jgi:hypothetical protein